MRYLAKGKMNRHFELFNERQESLGTSEKVAWYSRNGIIRLPSGKEFSVSYSGTLRNIANLKEGDKHICAMKPVWNGLWVSVDGGDTYKLKRKGILNSHYVLLTEHQHEILTIKRNFKFTDMTFTFEVNTDDNYNIGKAPEIILLFISVITAMQQGTASV